MRTGNLDVQGDALSEIWFANGWFRSIGSTNTTRFEAQLAEVDIALQLPRGQLKAFGGYIHYADNDPGAGNQRDVYYYAVELVHDLSRNLYAAARFSRIVAPDGFPIVGNGDVGYYLFGPLTRDIWRLSLGAGYRWNRNFILKTEYAFEQGAEIGGRRRTHNDLFAAQAAFRF
jgi:hypothetical protein